MDRRRKRWPNAAWGGMAARAEETTRWDAVSTAIAILLFLALLFLIGCASPDASITIRRGDGTEAVIQGDLCGLMATPLGLSPMCFKRDPRPAATPPAGKEKSL